MIEKLEIAAIDRTGLNTRATLNAEAIRDYAEAMRENPEALPPIEVYRTQDGKLLLADGFHRVAAALSLGMTEIAAEVREGEHPDALRAALIANVKHGMRRTNADKRQSMKVAWEHRKELFGHEPTEREFATVCAVSNGLSHGFLQDMSLLKMSKPTPTANLCGSAPLGVTTNTQLHSTPTSPPSPTPQVPVDRFKLAIPESLREIFASRGIAPAGTLIKKARRFLKLGVTSGNRAFAALAWQRVDTTIENLLNELKFALPYCVCRMCRGFGCDACNQRGFQTKLEYERNPEAYKYNTII